MMKGKHIEGHSGFISAGPPAAAADAYFNICFVDQLIYLHKYDVNEMGTEIMIILQKNPIFK